MPKGDKMMDSMNVLMEVRKCPDCGRFMGWWMEKDGKTWRCKECGHTEPYRRSTPKTEEAEG